MIGNRNKNGLKGQYNLAQGKRRRSVALGWRARKRVVRAIIFFKALILFRTKEVTCVFRKWSLAIPSERDYWLCLLNPTDGFSPAYLTQGGVSVRSSLNYALG